MDVRLLAMVVVGWTRVRPRDFGSVLCQRSARVVLQTPNRVLVISL